MLIRSILSFLKANKVLNVKVVPKDTFKGNDRVKCLTQTYLVELLFLPLGPQIMGVFSQFLGQGLHLTGQGHVPEVIRSWAVAMVILENKTSNNLRLVTIQLRNNKKINYYPFLYKPVLDHYTFSIFKKKNSYGVAKIIIILKGANAPFSLIFFYVNLKISKACRSTCLE